jgi:uncharacterized RDD family membrane protein YckC
VLVLATGQHLASGKAIMSSGTLLSLFLIEWGYFVAFEAGWNGTTPGKRALKLRVVKVGGYPLSFMDAVLRNLLRTADFLPVGYLLGLVAMTWDGRFARLGDRAAGTMVVIEDPVRVAPVDHPGSAGDAAEIASFPHRIALPLPEREAIELLAASARSVAGPALGAGRDPRARGGAPAGREVRRSGAFPRPGLLPGGGRRGRRGKATSATGARP